MVKFFTFGYGGMKPADFLDRLSTNGIRTVVDVRLRPDRASMGAFVKAKDAAKGIEGMLARHGIGYRSLVELGNPFLGYDDWRDRYRELIALAGDLLTARLSDVPGPFCLLCAEKRPDECHRQLIADHLSRSRGWQVEHML